MPAGLGLGVDPVIAQEPILEHSPRQATAAGEAVSTLCDNLGGTPYSPQSICPWR
jgi:hypothetical protein